MTRATHDTLLRRFPTALPGTSARSSVSLSPGHPASAGARTIFVSRVFDPGELPRLLKSGHHSRKIGKTVAKGARRGWPIFTLTLEERASCPRSCATWNACYGNNMYAAERVVHGPDLMAALERELAGLQKAHAGGFLIRLHVLGDRPLDRVQEALMAARLCNCIAHIEAKRRAALAMADVGRCPRDLAAAVVRVLGELVEDLRAGFQDGEEAR